MTTQVGPITGLAAGRIFSERYEIIELLGRGGMGAVYLAKDRDVGEKVALKVLEARSGDDDAAIERFRREVRLARRVTHANVARTYDLGMWDGIRYLSMEFVGGHNLQDILRVTRFGSKQVVSIALQLCAGLAAAHDAGVVHRDLKPENILVENDTGRVVITDFGIARALDQEGDVMQTVGAIGTPAYMSPEQLDGKTVDQRTDIYALGLILYQMCTGVHPFLKATALATAMARLKETPPAPREVCEVDAVLSAVIMECLALDPDERPESMRVVAARLSSTEFETFVPRQRDVQPFASLPKEGKRIAITQFRYRGPKEDEYLAEVLTEELIDVFSMTEGLQVVGPAATSLLSSQGGAAVSNVRELSEQWHVQAVVVGTIQKAGEQLRIAARLIECPSGRQIWSENFNGKLDSVFDLQDRIAKRVAEALRIELVQNDLLADASPEAVEHYLRARHAAILGYFSDSGQIAALLERCLELEPRFKPALAAMARARTTLWFMGSGDNAKELAEQAVAQALLFAPELAESHLAAGIYATNCGDTFNAARSMRRALQIAPTYGEAHEYLGRLQLESGRPDEGIERVELAIALNPSNIMSLVNVAREYALRGAFDAYEQVVARCKRRESNNSLPLAFVELRVMFWQGDMERFRSILERDTDFSPRYQQLRLYGAGALGDLSPEEFYRQIISRTERNVSQRGMSLTLQLGCEVLASKGRGEMALELLQRAADGALVDLSWLDRCPAIDSLRGQQIFLSARAKVVGRAEAIWSI